MKIDGFVINNNPFIKVGSQVYPCCHSTREKFDSLRNVTRQQLPDNGGSSTIGLFGYEELGSNSKGFVCLRYSDTHLEYFLDGPWKAARAFGIIANLCSGVTLLCFIGASCFALSAIVVKVLAGGLVFGSFSILMTFLMFASDVSNAPFNGSFYFGGGMALIASILCFVAALLTLQIGPISSREPHIVAPPVPRKPATRVTSNNDGTDTIQPRRNFPAPKRSSDTPPEESAPTSDDIEAFQPGTETVTETLLPDGTRKTVTTKIGIDGSRTVKEVITRVK
jgi:hypothetical protein